MIGARALGDPVRHLLADDLVLIGRESLDIGMHQRDGLDRDLRLIEELQLLAALCTVVLRCAPGMSGDTLTLLERLCRDRECLAQVHLGRIGLGGEAFALLAENLTTEPLELVFQSNDPLGLRAHHSGEFRGTHRAHFREAR